MRTRTAPFALVVVLLSPLCLITDSAQAGPFRNRRAQAYNTNQCCPGGYSGYGYGSQTYGAGTGYGYGSQTYGAGTGYGSQMYYPSSGVGYGSSMYYPSTGYGSQAYYGSPGAYYPSGNTSIPPTYYQPSGVAQAGYTTVPGTIPGPMPQRVTEATKVRMTDANFEPASITVTPGTTIRWLNEGKQPHTVTSNTGAWDSGDILPGRDFTATFPVAGTYEYHCHHEKSMKGTIIVK